MSASEQRRVAIFYPWVDVLERNGGASVRVGHLIDVLRDSGAQVTVVSPRQDDQATGGDVTFHDGVVYRWTPPGAVTRRLQRLSYLVFRAVLGLGSAGRSMENDFLLWMHYNARLDPRFRRLVREVVATSDAVFVEYTFWGTPVLGISRRLGTTTIVTAHDVLAYQVRRSRLLRRLTLRQEVRSLRSADHAVTVSTDDQEVFRQAGADTVVVPHGIDIERELPEGSQDQLRAQLAERLGVGIPTGTICLFVGSNFTANIMAVPTLRRLAETTRGDGGAPVNIVVVGGCCAPEVDQNFLALGRVDENVLDLMYALAELVLIPLTVGTGASLKTIEAMARGKVVLGTSVGFRGFPVSPGENCILDDDFDAYPDIIRQLSNDPEARDNIAARARTFASAYDYRRTNHLYVELAAGCSSSGPQ